MLMTAVVMATVSDESGVCVGEVAVAVAVAVAVVVV